MMRVLIIEERVGLILAGYIKGVEYDVPDKIASAYLTRGWAVTTVNGRKMLACSPANKAHHAAPANK